jgi:hypothetical protein
MDLFVTSVCFLPGFWREVASDLAPVDAMLTLG